MKIFIITILMSFSLVCFSQNWSKITKNDVTIIILQGVSGAADGLNQKIVHHKFGEGNQFWDIKISWLNKYKSDRETPRFPGSTTVFVAWTDGFHATRGVDRKSSIISVGISFGELKQYKKKDIPKVIAKKALISWLANRAVFTLTYNSL